jgi:hypothetical protein
MADEKKTFVRGADGALYALSDDDLAPFKVEESKKQKVDEILKREKEDFGAVKLSDNAIKQIQAAGGCVKTTAELPEIYTNTKK